MFFSRPGIMLQRLQTIADIEEKLSLPHRVGTGIPTFGFFTRGNQFWIPNDAPRSACGAEKITVGIKGARIKFWPLLREVSVEILVTQGRFYEHAFLLVLDFEFSRHVHDIELGEFAPFDPNQIIGEGADVALPRIKNLADEGKRFFELGKHIDRISFRPIESYLQPPVFLRHLGFGSVDQSTERIL